MPVRVSASLTNCHEILAFDEPIALSTPISRRRSRTIISMLRKMITAPGDQRTDQAVGGDRLHVVERRQRVGRGARVATPRRRRRRACFCSALTVASRWSTLSTVTIAEVIVAVLDDSFCSAGSGMITPRVGEGVAGVVDALDRDRLAVGGEGRADRQVVLGRRGPCRPAPRSRSSVPSIVSPAVSLKSLTSDTVVLPGAVVPVTVIGSTKFAREVAADGGATSVLPLLRLPRVPGSIADCRLVVPARRSPSGPVGASLPSVTQRSSNVEVTDFTCAVFSIFVMSAG